MAPSIPGSTWAAIAIYPEPLSSSRYHSDEPNADAGALPVWFLSKLTKNSATVALSGDGGDELFAGYVTYRANILARTARRLPSKALEWAGAPPGGGPFPMKKSASTIS